jgi:hypothetical protein
MAPPYPATPDETGHLPYQPLAQQGAKVSFQSATANAWSTSFLRHLNAELAQASRQDHRQLMQRVCSAAQAMFDARRHTLPDLPSHTVLGMCALIVTAYRVLVVESDSTAKAFEMVERVFDQVYRAYVQNICKPLLRDSNHSPQTLARMNFRSWSERMYKGDSTTAQGAHCVALGSDLTGYHHFFREQGEPGLAHIIHAVDQAWIEAVAAYDEPPLREQRLTRARGTGFSPFHFAPKARVRMQARPDVILELQIDDAPKRFEAERRCNSYTADLRRNGRGTDRRRAIGTRGGNDAWSPRNPQDRRAWARV